MEKNTASISVITNYLVNIITELMRHEMKLCFAFSRWAHHPHSASAVCSVRKVCLEDSEIPSECVTVTYLITTIT